MHEKSYIHDIKKTFLNGFCAACNFIKKETLAQLFSCEFFEISKNTFLTEHLEASTSICGWLFLLHR